jgi:hypothetical protein
VEVKLQTFLTPTLHEGEVRFTLWLLYSWEKKHGYPLARRPGGPQSWSGPLLLQRLKAHAPRLWPVTILTELSQYKTGVKTKFPDSIPNFKEAIRIIKIVLQYK